MCKIKSTTGIETEMELNDLLLLCLRLSSNNHEPHFQCSSTSSSSQSSLSYRIVHNKNDDWKWFVGSLLLCLFFSNSLLLVFAFTFQFHCKRKTNVCLRNLCCSGSVLQCSIRHSKGHIFCCSLSLDFYHSRSISIFYLSCSYTQTPFHLLN